MPLSRLKQTAAPWFAALLLSVSLTGCLSPAEPSSSAPGAVITGGSTAATTAPTTAGTTLAPTKTNANEAIRGLLVNNPYGLKIDKASLDALEKLYTGLNSKASLYYRDIESGLTIEYLADYDWQSASCIKAPYVKYLLSSGVDRNEKLKMTAKMGGSTHIDSFPIGTAFTVDELLKYAILYSDNTAYYMLNQRYAFDGFVDYAASLGIETDLRLPKPRFGYLSARDAGLYFEDIYRFIEAGSEEGQMLYDYLTHTTDQLQIPDAFKGKYTVAHKYGEQGNMGYHDAAIVYNEHPYILTIFTTLTPETDSTLATFHKIAGLVDAIHRTAYGQG